MEVSMQRYWGSDDSDIGDDDQAAAKLKKVLKQAKRRSSGVHSGSPLALHNPNPSKVKNSKAKNLSTLETSNDTTLEVAGEVGSDDILPASSLAYSNNTPKRERKRQKVAADATHEKPPGDVDLFSSSADKNVNALDISKCNSLTHSNNTPKRERKRQKIAADVKHEKPPVDGDLFSYSADKNVNALDISKCNSDLDNPGGSSKNPYNKEDTEMFTVIGETKTNKNVNVKRILPEWLANPTIISIDVDGKKSSLSELDYLDDNTQKNLRRLGISHLFPVQAEVIPWLMQSNLKRLCVRPSDVCVSAPTGSGKTLAFVLPIIQSLKERVVCQVRALVVLPVGDLAVQVFKVFEQFCRGTDLHVALVVGQRSLSQEKSTLVKKGVRGFHSLVDIIVATPGRLVDHISGTEGFTLEYLKYLVIDEADRMMEEIQQGFLKRVEKAIFKDALSSACDCFSISCLHQKMALPPSTACAYGNISDPVQKLLFSATLSQDPERLHELSLFQPKLFTSIAKYKSGSINTERVTESNIIGKYTTPKGLLEHYVVCESSVKPLMISHLIHQWNFKRVLCFTKSVDSSHRLRLVLDNMDDIKVREISSNLQAVQRKIILQQFSSGKIPILVCTDIMSRGIDIENVDCVISYDAPKFIKAYIHRIGRTARAGRKGCAISLLEDREVNWFLRMLKQGGKKPAEQLEIAYEALKPMEEKYKLALDAVSRIVAEEKRNNFLLKESVKSVKSTKNERFRNSVRAKNNCYNNKR